MNNLINYEQYKRRNMYIERNPSISGLYGVASYNTLIGYIDMTKELFLTWGYGRYSVTTSKQITLLCREHGLRRVDIDDMSDIYKYINNKGLIL